jgi:hypothetical protein
MEIDRKDFFWAAAGFLLAAVDMNAQTPTPDVVKRLHTALVLICANEDSRRDFLKNGTPTNPYLKYIQSKYLNVYNAVRTSVSTYTGEGVGGSYHQNLNSKFVQLRDIFYQTSKNLPGSPYTGTQTCPYANEKPNAVLDGVLRGL